jgi:hypothetical protein
MLKQAPTPTPAQLERIAKLEADAKACNQRAEESFQRSDTDGFLSQWASNITADLHRHEADILRNGGHAQFPVLCNAAGDVLCTKVYTFANPAGDWLPYNKRWRLPDDVAQVLGRKWIPVGEKSRVQKQLGLHEEDRWFPAYAKVTTPPGSKSTGLGGCANAYVGVFKQEE